MILSRVETYYYLSAIPVLIYWLGVINMTLKNEHRITFYFKFDEEGKYFDFEVLKMIIQKSIYVYLTSFTCFNVGYYSLIGEWMDGQNIVFARGFMIPGLFVLFIDMFKKSFKELREERKKKNGPN